MRADEERFKGRVYDLVNGLLDLEEYPIEESKAVKNEFEEGSYCATEYSKVLDAYQRLCKKLGVAELKDDDVEIIINSLFHINRYVSMKMYDYGAYFAKIYHKSDKT